MKLKIFTAKQIHKTESDGPTSGERAESSPESSVQRASRDKNPHFLLESLERTTRYLNQGSISVIMGVWWWPVCACHKYPCTVTVWFTWLQSQSVS